MDSEATAVSLRPHKGPYLKRDQEDPLPEGFSIGPIHGIAQTYMPMVGLMIFFLGAHRALVASGILDMKKMELSSHGREGKTVVAYGCYLRYSIDLGAWLYSQKRPKEPLKKKKRSPKLRELIETFYKLHEPSQNLIQHCPKNSTENDGKRCINLIHF